MIRSAQSILIEIRRGALMEELSAALHEAACAVKDYGKAATVSVQITIKPQTKNMADPIVAVEAEVSTKLPKPDVEATIFGLDEDTNLTRNLSRQQDDLPFSIANQGKVS